MHGFYNIRTIDDCWWDQLACRCVIVDFSQLLLRDILHSFNVRTDGLFLIARRRHDSIYICYWCTIPAWQKKCQTGFHSDTGALAARNEHTLYHITACILRNARKLILLVNAQPYLGQDASGVSFKFFLQTINSTWYPQHLVRSRKTSDISFFAPEGL